MKLREKIDGYFGIQSSGSSIKIEMLAGITTFLAMVYIVIVNPIILTKPMVIMGYPENDIIIYKSLIFFATAFTAFLGTLIMGLYAKLPIAMASGMGLNAFFAFTVILQMGLTFQQALAAVCCSGILFLLLTLSGLRQKLAMAIPKSIQVGLTVGIGLFITLIGLRNAGIIVNNEATGVSFTHFSLDNKVVMYNILLAIAGILITVWMMIKRITGAMLIGIIMITIFSLLIGEMLHLPEVNTLQHFRLDNTWFTHLNWDTYTAKILPDFKGLFYAETHDNNAGVLKIILASFMIVITFSLVELFDTIGTLLGVGMQGGLVENGQIKNMKKAMLTDGATTLAGSFLGTSTIVAYIESGAGIAVGGKTGLTAVVTALLFFITLFLAPLFALVPAVATAPALVIIGLLMIPMIKSIDFNDLEEGLPAFATITIMPFSYSIANGIAAGIITYVLLKILRGKYKQVNIILYIIAILFAIRIFL